MTETFWTIWFIIWMILLFAGVWALIGKIGSLMILEIDHKFNTNFWYNLGFGDEISLMPIAPLLPLMSVLFYTKCRFTQLHIYIIKQRREAQNKWDK